MKKIEDKLKRSQNIRMTDMERISMRANIIAFMERISPTCKHIPSPFRYWVNPFLVTMCSFLFVIFGTTALAYQASDAVPGDFLYGVKIANEKVEGVLIKGKAESIMHEQGRIAKRIKEVKKLANDGKLTSKNVAIAEKNIEDHIATIDEEAKKLAENNPEEFIEVSKGLEPILDAHAKELTEILLDEEKENKKENTNAIKETVAETDTIDTTEVGVLEDIEKIKKENSTAKTPITEVAKKDEKSVPTDQVSKAEVVNGIIAKVQKESDSLKNIAEPIKEKAKELPTDKKEVKDTSIKTDVKTEVKALENTATTTL